MIEKTLKTTYGKLKIKIPNDLSEISLAQIIEIQDKPDLNDLEAISILSGLPLWQLNHVRCMDDLEVFSEHISLLSQQIKQLYDSDNVPQKVTFPGGKTVNVIHNLSMEPAGSFMAAREIISDEINRHIQEYGAENWQQNFNPSLKACCQVLAHYFFCRVTGKKYNEYEAEEFCNDIKKLRVTEALPIAKHFFICYPNLSKQKISFFHRLQQYWRKKPEYKRSKSLSISTP
ncbi:MAG: hypothetical protein ACHQF4_09760 [Sphingobacteriales bacterium]